MTSPAPDPGARRRLVALEEHMLTDSLFAALTKMGNDYAANNFPAGNQSTAGGRASRERLFDLGERRLRDMDDQGVDVQVLSVTTPGVQGLSAEAAVPAAREVNDLLAGVVAGRPDRFEAFAVVPTGDGRAAGDELRRAVGELGLRGAMLHGRTGTMMLDHPSLEPLWQAANELRCPIYLHPQPAIPAVADLYYSGFDPGLDALFRGGAIGWHYETGIHLLRLILGGTLDRHPDVQLILGHWGEVVLFYAERVAELKDWGRPLARPFEDYLCHQVSVTPAGMYTQRYFRWAKEVLGIDRILYASDYPYVFARDGIGPRFLADADLTDDERDLVAHGNWERLTAHLR